MISQPIDQKPIAETLTGQEGDNIIVPDDEVWYVTLDSRDMLAKIDPEGTVDADAFNWNRDQNSSTNIMPVVVPGGSAITISWTNGSDHLRISGWEISDLIKNDVVAHSIADSEFITVPDNEVWNVRVTGRSVDYSIRPTDSTSFTTASIRRSKNTSSSEQVMLGGDEFGLSWTDSSNDRAYVSGFVVQTDYDGPGTVIV